MECFGILVASGLIFGVPGLLIYRHKGRSPIIGFLAGLIFGPLGWLLLAISSNLNTVSETDRLRRRVEELERK